MVVALRAGRITEYQTGARQIPVCLPGNFSAAVVINPMLGDGVTIRTANEETSTS